MFKLSKSPTLSSLAAYAAGSVTSSRSGGTSGTVQRIRARPAGPGPGLTSGADGGGSEFEHQGGSKFQHR